MVESFCIYMNKEVLDRLPFWAKELLKLKEEAERYKQQKVATDRVYTTGENTNGSK